MKSLVLALVNRSLNAHEILTFVWQNLSKQCCDITIQSCVVCRLYGNKQKSHEAYTCALYQFILGGWGGPMLWMKLSELLNGTITEINWHIVTFCSCKHLTWLQTSMILKIIFTQVQTCLHHWNTDILTPVIKCNRAVLLFGQ